MEDDQATYLEGLPSPDAVYNQQGRALDALAAQGQGGLVKVEVTKDWPSLAGGPTNIFDLPDGWEQKESTTKPGVFYYMHKESGQKQFERPTTMGAMAGGSGGSRVVTGFSTDGGLFSDLPDGFFQDDGRPVGPDGRPLRTPEEIAGEDALWDQA